MPKKRRRSKKNDLKLQIRNETLYSILGVLFIAMGVLVVVSFTGQGQILQAVNQVLTAKLGIAMLILPFVFFSAGLMMFSAKWPWAKPSVFLGSLIFLLASLLLLKSGEIGSQLFANLAVLISAVGVYITGVALLLIAILVAMQSSVVEIIESITKNLKEKQKQKEEKLKQQEKEYVDGEVAKARHFTIPKLQFGKKEKELKVNDPQAKTKTPDSQETPATAVVGENLLRPQPKPLPVSNKDGLKSISAMTPSNAQVVWEYPPLSLLSDSKGGQADRGDVRTNASIIENTLESFAIKARVAEVNYGPSVTQYALEITKGTRLAKITSLATDLALALAAPTGQIRIEAPIAGRSLVGVEVPNNSASFVTLRTILKSKQMTEHKSKLAVGLGIGVSGKSIVADIASMPHLLIAGATGSGKSVCVNSFLCSILFRASPNEVKFILVDPKRVELTGYNDIPHLLTPVIVEPSKVVSALKWAVALMDKRYKQLAEVGVRNISAYNELAGLTAMPSVIIVIDELADVMLFAPNEVEECVTRIAQMARAVGIHLVLATQRPSVDVITGLIKANIPTRIAFNVMSMMDSRVILDQPGAEKLLGRGDMLYIPPDQAKPTRIQGTYVSDQEIKNLIDFIKAQGQKPEYEEEIVSKYKAGTTLKGGKPVDGDSSDRDEMFNEAVRLFAKYDKASSSLIQRRLSVGYARAARILDQLYEAGLVGPPEGSKPREVNLSKIQEYLGSLQSLEE